MSQLFNDLQKEKAKQKQMLAKMEGEATEPSEEIVTRDSTPKATPSRDIRREVSSDNTREKSRKSSRDLPTRDEIQEFSFRLRDALKVKVQAEVPHEWQDELETIARDMNVKKLELYRFIFGEFLGKVKR